jgi:2-hydroxychromene-2-carboxylate isomerase
MKPVEFLFDFGSPNAYLAHKVIPAIEARTGVPFVYVPILLGGVFKLTHNRSPIEQFKDIPSKLRYQQIEIERFVRKHRIDAFRWNPHFPVNTVQVMRGAIAADMEGLLKPYADAVFHHMWEAPIKMDESETIRTALRESGLDADRILARIQDQDVKDALLRNTEAAVARGVFGSPTFFVGEEIFFGKDRLREVEEEILAGADGAGGH